MNHKSDGNKLFIGVAWPYVNGDLHIGHLAGYLLPADISARYHRIIGRDVLMVSGSDCFGTPITVEADKRGVSPKAIVEEYHEKDVDLFCNVLELSYDLYTKTDHPHHIETTQDFFIKLLEEGYIFSDTTEQYYSPSEEKFLPDRYVVGTCAFCGFTDARSDQCDHCGKLLSQTDLLEPRSNLTSEPVTLRETEHYFLDWPKLQPQLEKYVNKVGPQWKNWVYQETLGWLKEGLKPRAITRDIDWGVPLPHERIPEDKQIDNSANKRLYVWFDAVIGYFSASKLWAQEKNTDWERFWYGENVKHYYFMGKDNLVFHSLFWPGKLMVYDPELHVPDIVSINMFLNLEGKQFSKSRGVVIDTRKIVEKFGNDPVRFYLTLIMPETRDSSFNWEDFEEKVNGILVANIGNFIHRTLSIGTGVDMEKLQANEPRETILKEINNAFVAARSFLEEAKFKNYLEVITELSAFGNKLFDEEKVWQLKKEESERYYLVLNELLVLVAALGYLMAPLLPHANRRLFEMLELGKPKLWPETLTTESELVKLPLKMNLEDKPVPLFQKIEASDYEEFV